MYESSKKGYVLTLVRIVTLRNTSTKRTFPVTNLPIDNQVLECCSHSHGPDGIPSPKSLAKGHHVRAWVLLQVVLGDIHSDFNEVVNNGDVFGTADVHQLAEILHLGFDDPAIEQNWLQNDARDFPFVGLQDRTSKKEEIY